MNEQDQKFIPFEAQEVPDQELEAKVSAFYHWANQRRSLRTFSDKPVPKDIMEKLVMTGSTAPSGANKQPWTFCLISNKALKSKLRALAEEEEKISYGGRMSEEWLKDLEPFATNWEKEFIDVAPWIVVVMKRAYEIDENGTKHTNYYVSESVGIAVGFFLMAVHNAGLVALTHTPSPMNFISKALNRPENERPYLLIPVGYPSLNAMVPAIERKKEEQVIEYYE